MATTQKDFKVRLKQYTAVASPVEFDPPIRWIEIIEPGDVTLKDEAGSTIALTGLLGGEVYEGFFVELTSMTSAKVRLGDGAPPKPTVTTTLAGGVAYPDASGYTMATTAEAALDELYAGALTAQATIEVPIGTGIDVLSAPLAAFADSATSDPGITLADAKSVAIRWNNAAVQEEVYLRVVLPQDLDDSADVVVHLLASKSGATLGDATTFDVAAYFQTVGALHDADANAGGTSSPLVGNAAPKTVTELTVTILAADVPAAPCALTLSVKPTDGTLGTDDAFVHCVWIEYKRKLLAA